MGEGAWPLLRAVPRVQVGVVQLDLDQPPVQQLRCRKVRARQHPHAPLPCLLGHGGELVAEPLGRLGQLGQQRARAPARTRLDGGVARVQPGNNDGRSVSWSLKRSTVRSRRSVATSIACTASARVNTTPMLGHPQSARSPWHTASATVRAVTECR